MLKIPNRADLEVIVQECGFSPSPAQLYLLRGYHHIAVNRLDVGQAVIMNFHPLTSDSYIGWYVSWLLPHFGRVEGYQKSLYGFDVTELSVRLRKMTDSVHLNGATWYCKACSVEYKSHPWLLSRSDEVPTIREFITRYPEKGSVLVPKPTTFSLPSTIDERFYRPKEGFQRKQIAPYPYNNIYQGQKAWAVADRGIVDNLNALDEILAEANTEWYGEIRAVNEVMRVGRIADFNPPLGIPPKPPAAPEPDEPIGRKAIRRIILED